MADLELPIPIEKRAELQMRTLRPLVSNEPEKFRPDLIAVVGETTSDEQRAWASSLMIRPDYAGPVRCTPWDGFRNLILTGETAIHTVDLLMHEVFGVVFSEETSLPWDTSDPMMTRRMIRLHVLQNSFAIGQRAAEIARSINTSQWLELFALASGEIVKLLNPLPAIPNDPPAPPREYSKLVTVDDVAAMLVDVGAKTLQNHDVKKWGPPDGKVNRFRAWNLDRIRPIIEKTRQFKDV